jgi:response regulator RpfG family c-di-GMP phosphodiesterase
MNMKDQSLRVLMVDDSEDDIQLIIRELKKGGYNPVYERVETADAMKKNIEEKQLDIILCDYEMPKFNAPSAITVLKKANIDIPIIIVSGTIGEETVIECMRLGAQDYIMKGNLSRLCPAIARELKDAEVRSKKKQAEFQREAELDALRQNITEYKLAEEKLQQTIDKLKHVIDASMQVMVSAVETRDPYTYGHQLRSTNMACAIATDMGLDQDKKDGIKMAGGIYEIGNLCVPAEILSKASKLSNIEISLIKEHSLRGYEMLKNVGSPWPLAEIVYQHHERMNGSGYPRNLTGDEILMESRILAVSDVLESMSSRRPYRPALGLEVALEEIEKNKGILYDNAVVDTCLKLFREGRNS